MLKHFLPFLFLCFFLVPACSDAQDEGGVQQNRLPSESVTISKQDGASLILDVEMALTPSQQATGLMGRTKMADDEGMLFVFNGAAVRGFWMKNTLIPLDMLFIDLDGTIHHIAKNTVPHSLSNVTSGRPAKAVLEVRGGLSDDVNIRVGDRLVHSIFK